MKRVPAPVSIVAETSPAVGSSDDDDDDDDVEQPRRGESEKQQVANKRNSNTKFPYGTALPSPLGSTHSFDIQVSS